MNRESMERLRLDRRLIGRKNWTSQAEVDAALEALPDVSDKIAEVESEGAAEEGAGPTGAEASDSDTSAPFIGLESA